MDWKKYAHLFANGKFKCKVRGFDSIYSVEEYTSKGNEFGLRRDEIVTFRTYASECTLIARKIDSLSNDDITGICEDLGYDHILTSERRIIEEYLCSETEGFLHLLSTGVYPFDQSHFETGEVIDINTLKKT